MPESMALIEMGDRELLNLLDGLADNEGWCDVEELADAIGLDHKNPTHCVGARLGGMRSLGMVERKAERREGKVRRLWRLTPKGEFVGSGRLKAAQRRAIDEAAPEELVVMMQGLGSSFLQVDRADAMLLNRTWRSARVQRKFSRNGRLVR